MLTQAELSELFAYREGVLYWKVDRGSNKVKGKPVGSSVQNRYLETRINRKVYMVHRLIYQLVHGECPPKIDHINGNCFDNRVENLRPATAYQNTQNAKLSKNNTSGIKGVYYLKHTGKWAASIRANGVYYYFGSFATIEEAAAVMRKKREELHGGFANHGGGR